MAPHADISTSPAASSENLPVSTSIDSGSDHYRGYDHVDWYVGNAKQAVTYYVASMVFKQIAYRALDTGSRVVASYVVQNGDVTFVLTSPLKSAAQSENPQDKALLKEISNHLETHGDAVKDVAFKVDNVDEVYYQAITNGGKSVTPPHTDADEFGSVRMATIKTYGETTHTLIERKQYTGPFLPGYKAAKSNSNIMNSYLPPVHLESRRPLRRKPRLGRHGRHLRIVNPHALFVFHTNKFQLRKSPQLPPLLVRRRQRHLHRILRPKIHRHGIPKRAHKNAHQ